MTRFLLPLLALSVLLVGCGRDTTAQIPLLENPLYLERYAEELVNSMVNMEIYENAILEDPDKRKIVDKTRNEWLDRARKARNDQRDGMQGSFITADEYIVGDVLYHENMVHFDTAFSTSPGGPSVHVYLSQVVDPRHAEFPGAGDHDLGALHTPYGAQSYHVPPIDDPISYRSIVLWDTALERIVGFAQLNVPLNVINR